MGFIGLLARCAGLTAALFFLIQKNETQILLNHVNLRGAASFPKF